MDYESKLNDDPNGNHRGDERERHLDYMLWIQRVIGWDAMLPVFIATTSVVLAKLFNNRPPADIIILAVFPALAFVVRLGFGVHQIRSNACGFLLRKLQVAVLFLSLLPLILVDFIVGLSALVPANQGPMPEGLRQVVALAALSYIFLATIAMYPGRSFRTPSQQPLAESA